MFAVAMRHFRQRIEQGPPVEINKCRTAAWLPARWTAPSIYFGRHSRRPSGPRREYFPPGTARARRSARQPRRNYFWAGKWQRRTTAHLGFFGTIERRRRLGIFDSRAGFIRAELRHRLAAIRTEATGASVRTTKLRYATSLAVPSSQLTESATVAADGTTLPVLRFLEARWSASTSLTDRARPHCRRPRLGRRGRRRPGLTCSKASLAPGVIAKT